ncbi:hypothetical protein G6F65_018202 [Rhizopus arrhizus]|nr:hypothetical protein G6F65_018202 [Rhizopus arrhizus]
MTPTLFRAMAADMLPLLHAERGDITAAFPYFINKSAPISGVQSLLDSEVQWIARAQGDGVEFELVVQVPVTSLCPCSKAISEYGAHNQRSHVTVSAILSDDISMDGVIRLIEEEGSCELWGLLKRPDEKYVTERAYDNPKFVEDLVRDPRTSNRSTTTRPTPSWKVERSVSHPAASDWPLISGLQEWESRLANHLAGRGRFGVALYEFFRFGVKQAWACLFGGLMCALLLGTHWWYPKDAALARYDFLTLAALGIQALLLALGME